MMTAVQTQAIEILEKQIEEINNSDAYTAFTRHFAISNCENKIENCKDSKYYAENFLKNNA